MLIKLAGCFDVMPLYCVAIKLRKNLRTVIECCKKQELTILIILGIERLHSCLTI